MPGPLSAPIGPPHAPGYDYAQVGQVEIREAQSPVLRSEAPPHIDPRAFAPEYRPARVARYMVLRSFGHWLIGQWTGLHTVIAKPALDPVNSALVRETMVPSEILRPVLNTPAHTYACQVPVITPGGPTPTMPAQETP